MPSLGALPPPAPTTTEKNSPSAGAGTITVNTAPLPPGVLAGGYPGQESDTQPPPPPPAPRRLKLRKAQPTAE